jgi:hypothetical protein
MTTIEERRRILFSHLANDNKIPRRRIISVSIMITLKVLSRLGGLLYILNLMFT